MARFLSWVMLFSVLLIVPAAVADEPGEPHPLSAPTGDSKMAILKPSNHSHLAELLKGKLRIVYVQLEPDQVTASDATTLMEWVRGGGSLWFSDCRMASLFGMRADPINGDDVTFGAWKETPYGDKHHLRVGEGMFFPVGKHPVLESLSTTRAFLLAVAPAEFSAVRAEGDVVGLLCATPNPQASGGNQMVAAVRYVDKGTVVFKPLPYEGRFEPQLLQWAVDYKPLEGVGSTPIPTRRGPDRVTTTSGETLDGEVQNVFFICATAGPNSTEMTASKTELRDIVVAGGKDSDVLVYQDGRKVLGTVRIGERGVELRTTDGKIRRFSKIEVARVEFGVSGR